MPNYRTRLGMVHMRGRNLPKPCAAVIQQASGLQIICCAISEFLCDGLSATDPNGTCDKPLCPAHAREIGRNRHLCPACHLEHRESDPQAGLFTGMLS